MKESEIRPNGIFEKYLDLTRQDSIKYFSDTNRIRGNCPACNIPGKKALSKHGFRYDECPSCLTLFVNPRPEAAAFRRYYTESASAKFWADTFYKETADVRREKIWRHKAELINNIIKSGSMCSSSPSLIDIGGGYGIFSEEMTSINPEIAVVVIEPSPHLAEVCRSKRLRVVEKFLEDVESSDLPTGCRLFVCFELFEHLHDVSTFLRHLYSLMSSGDQFIFTTLSSTGLDIQVLWGDSKAVSPPHHLNFFNPNSIALLLKKLEFEVLEITTPGRLDVDILNNSSDLVKDRFWRTFLSTASEHQRAECQAWVTSSGLSSHMMVVCRKG
jgi:2-polyprenyl-3-methyl-5-hydroxy-6-metoxy-1,4-benzoquinol methylase